uniref:Uncharacterized protein n=1 Tax=Coccidioides posadasii RMSCC 3488 TaxID=454284 RepID=A0A0J6FJ89_COCPO|nr:hypothetical protein CPAG_06684 [Coccidioides posadasii RMSCC 3488]
MSPKEIYLFVDTAIPTVDQRSAAGHCRQRGDLPWEQRWQRRKGGGGRIASRDGWEWTVGRVRWITDARATIEDKKKKNGMAKGRVCVCEIANPRLATSSLSNVLRCGRRGKSAGAERGSLTTTATSAGVERLPCQDIRWHGLWN